MARVTSEGEQAAQSTETSESPEAQASTQPAEPAAEPATPAEVTQPKGEGAMEKSTDPGAEAPKEETEGQQVDPAAEGGEPVVINLRDDVQVPSPQSSDETFYGEFNTKEEFIEAHEALGTKYKELDSEYKAFKEGGAFADERIKQLNEYVAKGGDFETWSRMQSLDTESMSPFDQILESKMIALEEAGHKVDRAVVKRDLERRFEVRKDELGDDDPVDKQRVEDMMVLEAAQAKTIIDRFKSDNSVPRSARDAEAALKMEASRVEAWGGKLEESIGSMDSIDMEFSGSKFQWPVPKQEKAQLFDTMASMIQNSPDYDPGNPEHVAEVQAFAKKLYLADNFDRIVGAVVGKIKVDTKVETFKETHNSSDPPSVKAKPESMSKEKTAGEVLSEMGY